MNFILKVIFEALASKLHVIIAPKQTTLLSVDGIMECFSIPASSQMINCSRVFLFCVVSTCVLQSNVTVRQMYLTSAQNRSAMLFTN